MPERAQPGEGLPQWGRDQLAKKAAAGGNGSGPPVTPRQMLEQGWEYHAYCQQCDESRRVDLQRMVRAGQGDKSLRGRRLRCQHCGHCGSGTLKRLPARR